MIEFDLTVIARFNTGRTCPAFELEFKGEIGVQLVTHLASQHSIPDLVNLAKLASEKGIDRVWIDDNLRFRNVFVILSAVAAANVKIGIGTGIMVPYFRNPIDTADALAAISEMIPGQELSIGIARGSTGIVPYQLETEPAISFMRESVVLLKSLLAGKQIAISDFPRIQRYFRFKEYANFKLAFAPAGPIKFYHGCSGTQAARLAGEEMDGILISGIYIALLRAGRVARIVESVSPKTDNFVKACEINISVSRNRDLALRDPKLYLAHVIPGTFDALGLIEPLGIDRRKVELMKERFREGVAFEELKDSISDEDVRKCYIAGSPNECLEQLSEVLDKTVKLGFDRISFKLGPDYKETIELIGDEIIPALRGK